MAQLKKTKQASCSVNFIQVREQSDEEQGAKTTSIGFKNLDIKFAQQPTIDLRGNVVIDKIGDNVTNGRHTRDKSVSCESACDKDSIS